MGKTLKPSRTLGPMGARLIDNLLEAGKLIFTLQDAVSIVGKPKREISLFLRHLVNRGILFRLKSGIFLIIKKGQENTQLSNWPKVVEMLSNEEQYFISHYSAMRLHGMTTHALVDIQVTVMKRKRSRKIQNLFYHFIYAKSDHFWGYSELWFTRFDKVFVSDLERTILDGLERPDLCGGISDVIQGIWMKQKDIQFTKMIEYCKRYRTIAAVKRLGFILDTLNIQNDNIQALQEIVEPHRDYVDLEPGGEKYGKYNQHWRIRINLNLEEIKEGVWR